jgi:two-component system sensor histidine kinase/response regulator
MLFDGDDYSEAGWPQLQRLLAFAASAILVLDAVLAIGDCWRAYAAMMELSHRVSLACFLRVFELALVITAAGGTRRIRHNARWRPWVIMFCAGFFACRTAIGVVLGESAGLLTIVLMIVTVNTALLIPWSARWQSVLAALSLLSLAMHSTFGLSGPADFAYLIMLALVNGCALSFLAFRTCHKHQEILIAQLHETEHQLRNEIRERGSASQVAAAVAEKNAQTLRNSFRASADVMAALEGGVGGRFFAVNPAFVAFHGYARDEVKGKTLAELNLLRDPDQLTEIISKFEQEGHIQNAETAFRTKDGRIVWGLLSLATVNVVEQRYIFWTVRDISDRKQMEADLIAARAAAEAASRAKSEFLSSMSHEIRTAMNAVLGMAHLLAETELSEDQRHYLELMATNANSLLELINGILDLAKIESGRMQLEHSEFDLTELIDKTVSTFAARAHSKGLELVARIAPEVPERVAGDPLRLRQVLTNLVSNAIKFTEIGEVVLQVERAGTCDAERLEFSVTDSGIGIPKDKLECIFRDFTQAESSSTRKYGGSGLGLAIAHRLVLLMDGNLLVESQTHKGSRFSFVASFGPVNSINPDNALSKLTGCRVLIVDDNHTSRLATRETFLNCGIDVEEASRGEAALSAILQAVLEGRPYRMIFLDLGMPGMDGYEVLQRMRAMQLPLDPVIPMLTCDKLKSQIDRLQGFGIATRLLKPLGRKAIMEALRSLIVDGSETRMNSYAVSTTPLHATAGKRILVAEDSPDNRLVIAAYLRREPHYLDFAEDGLAAYKKFTNSYYDLVLIDIQMPEMDGLDATRAIRQWELEHGRAPAPIVALTAYALEEDARRALAAGCNLHLRKPLRKRALIECIHNATQDRDAMTCSENYPPTSYCPAEPPLVI